MATQVEQLIADSIERTKGQERTGGYFVPEGDCYFYMRETPPHYGVWVSSLCTVFRAQSDDRIVGVQTNGVSTLKDKRRATLDAQAIKFLATLEAELA